jgi:hypothetical protein
MCIWLRPGEPAANVLFQAQREILAYVLSFLFVGNPEVVSEAVRALGNLSRETTFRTDMAKSRGI